MKDQQQKNSSESPAEVVGEQQHEGLMHSSVIEIGSPPHPPAPAQRPSKLMSPLPPFPPFSSCLIQQQKQQSVSIGNRMCNSLIVIDDEIGADQQQKQHWRRNAADDQRKNVQLLDVQTIAKEPDSPTSLQRKASSKLKLVVLETKEDNNSAIKAIGKGPTVARASENGKKGIGLLRLSRTTGTGTGTKQKWLNELKGSAELESMSVLYAKSVLNRWQSDVDFENNSMAAEQSKSNKKEREVEAKQMAKTDASFQGLPTRVPIRDHPMNQSMMIESTANSVATEPPLSFAPPPPPAPPLHFKKGSSGGEEEENKATKPPATIGKMVDAAEDEQPLRCRRAMCASAVAVTVGPNQPHSQGQQPQQQKFYHSNNNNNNNNFGSSWVMSRSSRVEIGGCPSAKWNIGSRRELNQTWTAADDDEDGVDSWSECAISTGCLTKFARSLPITTGGIGGGLRYTLTDSDGMTDIDGGIGSPPMMDYSDLPPCEPSSFSLSIYKPNIRYRRKAPANHPSHHTLTMRRRGAGGGAPTVDHNIHQNHHLAGRPPSPSSFSSSSLCSRQQQSSANNNNISCCLPALFVRPTGFRHSIRVNSCCNEEGAKEADCEGEEDGEDQQRMERGAQENGKKHLVRDSHLLPSSSSSALIGANSSSSPQSSNEGSNKSTDSGQCSGTSPPFNGGDNCSAYSHTVKLRRQRTTSLESAASSQLNIGTSVAVAEEQKRIISPAEEYGRNSSRAERREMPSYARMANSIDQVLRLSSTIFSQLNNGNCHNANTQKLLQSTGAYIRLVEQCPCGWLMPHTDIELVRTAMKDVEEQQQMEQLSIQTDDGDDDDVGADANYSIGRQPHSAAGTNNDYLAVCVRRMLECSMLVFVRVLCHYLTQCTNHDRLLPIALEQFVHMLLFGDELCLEAVRHKAVDNLVALGLIPLTSPDTLKLILRTLAVLCGTAKGCLQLLSIGGLDLVLRVLLRDNGVRQQQSAAAECCFEAAGCLAQLSSPAHCFVRLSTQSLGPLVPRLLQLVDNARLPESLLLCLAALANLSTAQNGGQMAELLYIGNAVLRLIRAAQGTPECARNPFVQEQLVTILTRMANRGYERALLAQGAVPTLCRLIQAQPQNGHPRHSDLYRRIGYKAAVCLGCLASTGFGLRALHEQNVYQALSDASRPESREMMAKTPMQLICASIKQKLQGTYQQLETAV